jgi:GAF domain-containing protein
MDAGRDVLVELARVAADVGPALAPPGEAELLRATVDAAALAFRARSASIALVDDSGEELVFVVSSFGADDPIVGVRVPVGRGIAGWAVSSGQALAVDDLARDARFAREVAEATGFVPTTILAAPIETGEDVLGVIEVLDRTPGEGDLQLVVAFAHQVAVALSGSRAFGDLGRVLLESIAARTGDTFAGELRSAAGATSGPRAELAELAAAFAELGRLGEPERAAATRLVTHFLAYARSHQPR